jgi:hypothetical protein
MAAEQSRLGRIAAVARAQGPDAILEIAVNFALPFLIYSVGSARLGQVPALMAASAPPILWSIAGFIRERRVDAISILVLTGIALSLVAFAGGGGVKFLQLRENLVTGLVGLIFLGSVIIGRPLIHQLVLAGAGRFSPRAVAEVEALREDRGFRRALTLTTLAWAAGLLAASALNCTLVFILSIKQFMLISGPISYAAIGLLTLWTSWFVPHEKHMAEARRDAGIASVRI